MHAPDVDQALELEDLRSENTRLIALLESHGIEWQLPPQPVVVTVLEPEPSRLATTGEVTLFHSLFRALKDVYLVRWEVAK